MKNDYNDKDSGFIIHNILLLESSFKRIHNVKFNDPEINQDIHINTEVATNNEKNIITVTQTLHFSQIYNQEKQIEAEIKMVGTFEKKGESELDLESFGHVTCKWCSYYISIY